MYNNINLWFAKNANNDIVTINEIEVKDNKEKYYCPLCGSEVIPKATKSKLITAHFAHVDASKCSSESMIHWWFKHKFLESGDKFKVVSDKEKEYICKEILVEQSYTVGDKIYRPDVTVKTECGNTIYFEMKFSNEKKLKDYIDIWLELKNIVVEIDIKKLMSKDKLPVFNALFYDGKCFNVKKTKSNDNDLYYNTIGKYKEYIYKNSLLDNKKQDLIKLDWLWNDIKKYKQNNIDIEDLFNLIQLIEDKNSRNIVIDILKNANCITVVNDYVEFMKNKIKNSLNFIKYEIDNAKIKYSISIPHKIYDRVYSGFNITFYTENRLPVYSIRVMNENDINSDIIKKYNSELLIFNDAMNYMRQFNHTIYTNNINKYNYPSLTYYYSDSYNEHRLYFNNFGDPYNGYKITTKYYKTKEDLIDFIKSKVEINNYYTKDQIIHINKISEKVKSNFKNNKVKIYFNIYNGRSLYVSILYSENHFVIFDSTKHKRNIFDDKFCKNLCKDIEVKINRINLEKDIDNIITELNNKYKKISNNWSFLKNDNMTIVLFNENYNKILDNTDIINYKNNLISLDELKYNLLILISDTIRNYIYKKEE